MAEVLDEFSQWLWSYLELRVPDYVQGKSIYTTYDVSAERLFITVVFASTDCLVGLLPAKILSIIVTRPEEQTVPVIFWRVCCRIDMHGGRINRVFFVVSLFITAAYFLLWSRVSPCWMILISFARWGSCEIEAKNMQHERHTAILLSRSSSYCYSRKNQCKTEASHYFNYPFGNIKNCSSNNHIQYTVLKHS